MDKSKDFSAAAAAEGAENAAAEPAAGGQQRRENAATAGVSDDCGGGNQTQPAAAAALVAPAAPAREAPPARALPPSAASTWPPLSERLARKRTVVDAAKADCDAASGRATAALAAGDKEEAEEAARDLEAAAKSFEMAVNALKQEAARRERLRVAGLLDASTGDDAAPLPGGPPSLAALPFDMVREVLWRLPRDDARSVVPLVCSDWARLPLDVRACCESAAYLGRASRVPALCADAAALNVQLIDVRGRATMTQEALAAVLGAASRVESLTVTLKLDQLPMLAECLGARRGGRPSLSLRRLRLALSCITGDSFVVTRARMAVNGAALRRSAPGLELVEVMTREPWINLAGYDPVRMFLIFLLSRSAAAAGDAAAAAAAAVGGGDFVGGSGGARLRELRSPANILTSAFIDRLDESLSISKLSFLRTMAQVGVFIPRFPPLGGVSKTLRALRFEATAFCPCCGPSPLSVPGARWPFEAYCDVEGVSPYEALAPLAGSVTRLEFFVLGDGAALPQVLRLPGCFRALSSVRSLMVSYRFSTGVPMETEEAAAAAERAAERVEAAGGGADVVLARARPPSGRQQRPPQPWDLLSSLEELEVRFPLGFFPPFGTYELVTPAEGMPKLRRLDIRGAMMEAATLSGLISGFFSSMVPEMLRRRGGGGGGGGGSGSGASRRAPYLPPPPAAVPNLRWLGIGFFRRDTKPSPIPTGSVFDSFFSRALDLSALVPPAGGGSAQPSYRHLRSLVIEEADLVVDGGGREDDEVKRVIAAFPAVFPSLRMIHMHRCVIGKAAESVLAGLKDAYAAANRAASAGAGGGAAEAAAAASDDDDRRSSFLGVCRGCPAYDEPSTPVYGQRLFKSEEK